MRIFRFASALAALGLVFIFAQLSFAQNASVSGRVSDPGGLAVVGAKVDAVNTDTNIDTPVETNDSGLFNFPNLTPGPYRITLQKEGFEQIVKEGLVLHVADSLALNFTLTVGSVSQSVTVSGEAPLVNTTTSSLGGLVDDKRMADLPLNGRNYIDLSLMQSGISEQKTGTHTIGYVGDYVVSNGTTVRSNSYLLDGANMTNAWGVSSSSVTNSTLGVDGIKEYKVATNATSAEYGMTAGSQMIMISKSGTNAFHGDVFEYLRNSVMDAANLFDTKLSSGGHRLPPFKRNNFGASLAGPIRKDKIFFDAVYEGLRQRLGLTSIVNTWAAACVQTIPGTFTLANPTACSSTLSVLGPTVTVPVIEQPIYALGQGFAANLLGGPTGTTPQYTYGFLQPAREDYGQMRVDEILSSKDTLFERWTVEDSDQPVIGNFPGYYTSGDDRTQFITIGEEHVFSPTVLNTLRAHYSRTNFYWAGQVPAAATAPGTACLPGMPTCGLGIQGITTPASGTIREHKQNLYSQSDDVFYARGKNSFKFGGLLNEYYTVLAAGAGCCGTQTFPSILTFFQLTPSIISATTAQPTDRFRPYKFTTLGLYAQDDYRATSRLTLNIGLRYEIESTPYEADGHYSVIKDLVNDTGYTISRNITLNNTLKNFSPRVGFAWDVKGDGRTAIRGGIAQLFDIGQIASFVIQSQMATPPFTQRYSILNPTVPTPQNPNPAPFTLPLVFPTSGPGAASALAPRPTDWNLKQTRILEYNLTVERQLPFSMALTVAYAGTRGYNLADGQEGNPAIPQGVPNASGLCVARPAGAAVNTSSMVDGFATACWLGNDPRENQNFGTMDLFTNRGLSWYNSLQVGLIKRLTHGLQFQSSYTWSKSIDTQAGAAFVENTPSQAADGVDTFNINNERGPTVFDLGQVWKFNLLYNIPSVGSGVAQKFTGGWRIGSITTVQTGYPFSPGLNTERSLSGVQGGAAGVDRPDILPGRTPYNITHGVSSGCQGVPQGTPLGTTSLYFDPCAFAVPALGFLGDVGRNTLRGPGFRDVDLSLTKDTSAKFLGESGMVEFRAEIFNILNHPNLALPGRTVFNGNGASTGKLGMYVSENPFNGAGIITTTLGNSRQVQLALKILF